MNSTAYVMLQAQEIARLNGVYNKLLKGAGVEFIGELITHTYFQPCPLRLQ